MPDSLVSDCKSGHAVTLVGFGVLDGVEYWNIRNSWDTTWGNKGYFKMPIHAHGDDGPMCMYSHDHVGVYPLMKASPTPSPMPPTPTPEPTPEPTPAPTPAPTPLACKYID